jgi:hypothetical protein
MAPRISGLIQRHGALRRPGKIPGVKRQQRGAKRREPAKRLRDFGVGSNCVIGCQRFLLLARGRFLAGQSEPGEHRVTPPTFGGDLGQRRLPFGPVGAFQGLDRGQEPVTGLRGLPPLVPEPAAVTGGEQHDRARRRR